MILNLGITNRIIQNTNYVSTRKLLLVVTQERPIDQARRIANGQIDNERPCHYYPDLNRLNFADQIVYSSTDNHYDEPNNSVSEEKQYIQMRFTHSQNPYLTQIIQLTTIIMAIEDLYEDEMNGCSYGYDYAPSQQSVQIINGHYQTDGDAHRYNYLERQPTLRTPQSVEYNRLTRQSSKEK